MQSIVKASLFPVQEVAELQEQVQSSEREEMIRQQLMRKEAEQTRRAEETIRREQQVRESYTSCACTGLPSPSCILFVCNLFKAPLSFPCTGGCYATATAAIK